MKNIAVLQLKNSFDFCIISAEDYPRASLKKWRLKGKYVVTDSRLRVKTLVNFLTGKTYLDHINRDTLDNRRENLREATDSQNRANRAGWNGKSKYKGCYFYPNKPKAQWRSKITVNKRFIHLGYFETEVEAAKAYNIAAIKSFGDFAFLNDLSHLDSIVK